MTTIFLHIGHEKTGSTSLQGFLSENRPRLTEQGVLYPIAPGDSNHTGLAVFAANLWKVRHLAAPLGVKDASDHQAFRERLERRIREEVLTSGADRVIFSSEHCASRLDDPGIGRLADLLLSLGSKVIIVIYLRRQDDWFLSRYVSSVRGGGIERPEVPLKGPLGSYDYAELLDRWAKVFDKSAIRVRTFDRNRWPEGRLDLDFISLVGPLDSSSLTAAGKQNESLDPVHLEFRRLYNAAAREHPEPATLPRSSDINRWLLRMSGPERLALDAELLDRFYERCRPSNRRVAIEYCGGSGEDLFAERSTIRREANPPDLSTEQVMRIALGLLSAQSREKRDDEKRFRRRPATSG